MKQVSHLGTTLYVGGNFEKVTSGSRIEHKHYVLAPTGRVAVFSEVNDGSKEVRYFHTDGLGSITAITDEGGKVVKRFAFDAWGKRVDPSTGTAVVSSASDGFSRGFTDHEHLDDLGLVHMNGRVYDPVLGRFLSADPFVGDAADSQEFNRYSYLGNNPLGGTDPSGYFSLKDAAKVVAIVAIGAVTAYYLGPIAGKMMAKAVYGANVVLPASTVAAYSAAGAGTTGGFASSFSGSLLNGGTLGEAFKAGLIGGAIGAISGYTAANAMQNLPDILSSVADNAIAASAIEGFVNGATGGALDTAVHGGKLGKNVLKSAFMTSAGYGAAESAKTLWANYKLPGLVEKVALPQGLSSEHAAILRKALQGLGAAESITPAAALIGGVLGAGIGYAIGGDETSAAIGAVIGGGFGYYSSGVDVRAVLTVSAVPGSMLDAVVRSELFKIGGTSLPVRNISSGSSGQLYASLNASIAPQIFGLAIDRAAFGGFASMTWTGQLSSSSFSSNWQYFAGTGQHNVSIPRWGMWRGGRNSNLKP